MKRRHLIVALAAFTVSAAAAPLHFESAETPATLLELFSSEGCSSCPPAEAWISTLKDRADLWQRVVPVVWHVDYWDRLGWPDRFARPEFTARQHRYAAAWGGGSVYTPGFAVDGREWRGWFERRTLPEHARTKAGILSIQLPDITHADITFTPAAKTSAPLFAEVALLGDALETDVTRGENRGRKLRHDFTVLHFARAPLRPDGAHFSLPEKLAAPPAAIAAWIVSGETPAPLQATGGWLKAR